MFKRVILTGCVIKALKHKSFREKIQHNLTFAKLPSGWMRSRPFAVSILPNKFNLCPSGHSCKTFAQSGKKKLSPAVTKSILNADFYLNLFIFCILLVWFFMQLDANLYESISIILKGSAITIFQILKKHQCFSDYSRKIRISTYILSDYYSLIQPKISFKSWVNLFNLFYTVITFLKKTSAMKQIFYFLCYVNNYTTNEHLHYFAIYISIRSSQPF